MQDFSRYRVLQIIDTLALGGAERVAINIANALSQRGAKSFLCATRESGPLEKALNNEVVLLKLDRKSTFDISAIFRLRRFISDNQISIIHAHSSSLFIATIVKILSPGVKLVWHDHYGNQHAVLRNSLPYRMALRFADKVIAVNRLLKEWIVDCCRVSEDRVRYIPNFAVLNEAQNASASVAVELPGIKGHRVVAVANLRRQKDHLTLIRAFSHVIAWDADTHLLLIGDVPDKELLDEVRALISQIGLEERVSILGSREDVGAILAQCDIGVISSVSEGLPLALLEYGFASLAVVSTDVGQCREVLVGGEMGRVVPSGDSEKLGEAIAELLEDSNLREELGRKFQEHVQKNYSEDAFMKALAEVYETV
jgi:glycosyltransferase involved in cell wall biosynthesis